MNDGDMQEMVKVYFAFALLLIFRKSSCVSVKFTPSHSFVMVQELLGVGIASNLFERVLGSI